MVKHVGVCKRVFENIVYQKKVSVGDKLKKTISL